MTQMDYAWIKRWRYDRAHDRPRYVDAAPVRDHLLQLTAAGHTLPAIAAAAGVSKDAVYPIIRGHRQFSRRPTAAAILNVTAAALAKPPKPTDRVPAIGARRRIQALMTLGHTLAEISAAMGPDTSRHAAQNIIGRSHDHITRALHDGVRTAYDQLWDVPGHNTRVANHARTNGYPPPLAWDDDTIDDPDATPADTHQKRPAGKRVYIEDLEWLLAHDPTLTAAALAERCGVKSDAIYVACARGGRQDLTDRIKRNSNPDAAVEAA